MHRGLNIFTLTFVSSLETEVDNDMIMYFLMKYTLCFCLEHTFFIQTAHIRVIQFDAHLHTNASFCINIDNLV